MAEGQAVDIGMMVISRRTVIEEPTNAATLHELVQSPDAPKVRKGAHSSSMSINGQSKPIEFPDCVDARGADAALAIFDVPQLQVSTTSLRSTGSELKFCRPL